MAAWCACERKIEVNQGKPKRTSNNLHQISVFGLNHSTQHRVIKGTRADHSDQQEILFEVKTNVLRKQPWAYGNLQIIVLRFEHVEDLMRPLVTSPQALGMFFFSLGFFLDDERVRSTKMAHACEICVCLHVLGHERFGAFTEFVREFHSRRKS